VRSPSGAAENHNSLNEYWIQFSMAVAFGKTEDRNLEYIGRAGRTLST
jgi:hypothetical protein